MKNKKNDIDYRICLDKILSEGHDKCWVHARAGTIPGEPPQVVLTMQPWFMGKSDIFGPYYQMITDDLGKNWRGPLKQSKLGQQTKHYEEISSDIVIPEWQQVNDLQEYDEVRVGISDFTPAWHVESGKLLGTGHTINYLGDDPDQPALHMPIQIAYSIFDEDKQLWSEWKTVDMPDNNKYFTSSAGCTQRLDLENGDILLPITFREKDSAYSSITVGRFRFDGDRLKFIENGSEHKLEKFRGYAEPSLGCYGDKYFLTIRADDKGYIATGNDGLNFKEPVSWKWDDGTEVPTYNTQQHWVTHSDGLFLVYTRKAENNDHVFRHRAPLFIARVDPEKPALIRESERILVPERGARLGNFGVVNVTPEESWVTVSEVMSPVGCEKYGSDGSVYVAKIKWNKLNKLF